MKRTVSQCIKELAQFRRDRLTLALPLMTLLIFGFAIRLEAKDIPLVVQDFDRSNLSQRYTESLFATNQFLPVEWQGDAEKALDRIALRRVAQSRSYFLRKQTNVSFDRPSIHGGCLKCQSYLNESQ